MLPSSWDPWPTAGPGFLFVGQPSSHRLPVLWFPLSILHQPLGTVFNSITSSHEGPTAKEEGWRHQSMPPASVLGSPPIVSVSFLGPALPYGLSLFAPHSADMALGLPLPLTVPYGSSVGRGRVGFTRRCTPPGLASWVLGPSALRTRACGEGLLDWGCATVVAITTTTTIISHSATCPYKIPTHMLLGVCLLPGETAIGLCKDYLPILSEHCGPGLV